MAGGAWRDDQRLRLNTPSDLAELAVYHSDYVAGMRHLARAGRLYEAKREGRNRVAA